MKKVLLFWALLCLSLFSYAQMSITKTCDKLTAASGETFTYTLQYSCSSITGQCDNMVVTDQLPPEVEFVSAFGSIHTTAVNENNGLVTFTFQSVVNAGSTGELLITVRFPNGTTPDGTQAVNTATIDDDNVAPITSDPVTTTSTANCDWTVSKIIQGGGTPVIGENVTYVIEVCQEGGNGSLNLSSSSLIDNLPTGATFVSASDGGTESGGEVTWNLGALSYNDCYTRTVTVNFPSGTFSDGQSVANVASLSGTCIGEANGPLDSFTLNHTLADPVVLIEFDKRVEGSSTRLVGEYIEYVIKAENPGDFDVSNFIVTDTLPDPINLLAVKTGAYDTLNITIRYQTDQNNGTWIDWVGGPFTGQSQQTLKVSDLGLVVNDYVTMVQWEFDYMPAGFDSWNDLGLIGEIINPDHGGNAVNPEDTFTNTAYVDYDYNGTPTQESDETTVTIGTSSAAELWLEKGAANAERVIGQAFNYYVHPANAGGTPFANFVMTDTIPAAMLLTKTESGGWTNAPFTNVYVRYQTNLNNGAWIDWPGSPFLGDEDAQLSVSALGLASGDYVTMVQWDFGNVPVGFDSDGNRPRVTGTLLATDHNGDPVNVGDEIENCVFLSGENNGIVYTERQCASTTVALPKPDLDPAKLIVDEQTFYYPGDTVTFEIEIENNDGSTGIMVNPTVMDLLPEELEYLVGSWTITDNDADAAIPNFYLETNYKGTGRTLLRWDWTGTAASDFQIGDDVYIEFDVVIAKSVIAGEIINRLHMTSENTYNCDEDDELDIYDLDDDGDTTEIFCYDSNDAVITIPSLAALESEKLVKGELDDDWSKFPDNGVTTPGGLADYQLFVRNVGTVPMTDVIVIDILPFIGDKGVIDLSDRLSEWRPNLVGAVEAPSGVTVYYSTEGNPCRDELTPGVPASCNPPNWTTALPQNVTDVQALKFDFGSTVINPGDELMLEWPMRAPANAPDQGEIAWNSFGYIATRTDNDVTLLPAEPIKVGIQIEPVQPGAYGNFVWLDVNANGLQDGGEVGVDNVRVELYQDNGDGIADIADDELVSFTLTANGGFYLFPTLDADDYYAVFQLPPTYNLSPFQNTSEAGYSTDLDSDGQAATIGAFQVAITPITHIDITEDDRSWDLGLYQDTPPVAALGNYVWNDENGNGLQDESANLGINGIEVRLYEEGGVTAIDTVYTANDLNGNPGYYVFDGLDPNTNYFVEFVLQSYGGGLTDPAFTTPEQGAGGSDTNDSDAVVTGDPLIARTSVIDVSSGVYDDAWDAGIVVPSSDLALGNRVWEDTDNDGVYDYLDGEQGINGVKVNLYVDSDGSGDFSGGDVFYATTTTVTNGGIQGYYCFENLPAGDYIVEIDASNFAANEDLDGLISSTGNDLGDNTAPDPNPDTDHDDNGYSINNSIASKAISLTDDTGSDANADGDNNPKTNKTVDFGFYAFVCPEITALTSTPTDVCLGTNDVNITIQHDANPGDLALYYSTSTLTAADLYSAGNGGATLIAAPISPALDATSTTQAFTIPNSAGTYYVYAILGSGNANILDPHCLPMAIRSITVYESPNAGDDDATLTLCNNLSSNSTTIDLNTALLGADAGGTWAETTGTPSGSFNTSTAVFDADGVSEGIYTFTYTVTTLDAPVECNQDVATFTVTVSYCCPPSKCGRVTITRN
ncbi:MAG: SdrD B-like domain-containing protein [Chitinophagales bacterium]